jgi:hypothetical protein
MKIRSRALVKQGNGGGYNRSLAVIAGFAARMGLTKWLLLDYQQPKPFPEAGARIKGGDVYRGCGRCKSRGTATRRS